MRPRDFLPLIVIVAAGLIEFVLVQVAGPSAGPVGFLACVLSAFAIRAVTRRDGGLPVRGDVHSH